MTTNRQAGGAADVGIRKLPTGIPGFDAIALGGLPAGRTTLVSGTSGSGKTVLAAQFLAAGIERTGEPGIFVTFEESPADIRRNLAGFGWPLAQWEADDRWVFLDASPHPQDEPIVSGEYDLAGLLARIEATLRVKGAKRLALDSLGALLQQYPNEGLIRRELFRLVATLRPLGVTTVLTAERTEEHGPITRYGVEEFVADNVVVLRNTLEAEKRRRTIEILKFRGTRHQKGEWPFTVESGRGIVVMPLSAMELKQKSSDARITSGSAELDRMCGGGFFRDSIILVSGATGTGKTLTVAHFVRGGAERGERCLLFAFEESREQLFRNASGWGIDFERMEADGLLRVICAYPESAGLEEHLLAMEREVEEFKPQRVAVDSLSALERVSTVRGFREFAIGFTSFIKHHEIAGLFTATTASLVGGTSVTESHISTITDSIILLRYVEMFGEMRRGVTILKMRGSMHEKEIRELSIDGSGMHIGLPFRGVTGILAGNPVHVGEEEARRLEKLFDD